MTNIKSSSNDWESLVLEVNMNVVGAPAPVADYGHNNNYDSQYAINMFGEYEVMINNFQTQMNGSDLNHYPQALMLVSPQLNSTYGNRPNPIFSIAQSDSGAPSQYNLSSYQHVGSNIVYRSVFSGYLNLFIGEITQNSLYVAGQTTLPAPGIPQGFTRAWLTLLVRKIG